MLHLLYLQSICTNLDWCELLLLTSLVVSVTGEGLMSHDDVVVLLTSPVSGSNSREPEDRVLLLQNTIYIFYNMKVLLSC